MKTVLAHGTFDIVHPGHIQYLEFARKYGDRLIVAISSDYIVSKHKGPERPIVPFADRRHVISSLKFVDEVIETPAPSDDPAHNLMELVRVLRPDVFVSSYDNRDRYGAELQALGVEFILAPARFSTVNTTVILERVLERYNKRASQS